MNKGPYTAVSVATAVASYFCGIFFYNEPFEIQVIVVGCVATFAATLAFISVEYTE